MIYITKKNVWVAFMNKKGAIFWIFNSQRYVNISKCVSPSLITSLIHISEMEKLPLMNWKKEIEMFWVDCGDNDL